VRAKIWRNALIVGVVAAALEAMLVLTAHPDVNRWVLTQGVLFWFGCGIVVYMANSGLGAIVHGIVLTLILNVPWYIALAIAPGRPAMLPPLIGASIVLGAIIGWLRQRLTVAARTA
jgi:hypothetical protein